MNTDEKISNCCLNVRLLKSFTFSMINAIINDSFEIKCSDNHENENGNRILHLKCALSNGLSMQSAEEIANQNNFKNKNGWTPSFHAVFKNNKKNSK